MVPDLHGDSPPCAVSLPANQEQCTPEGCTLPLPKRSTLKSLQIKFSCLPLGTLTGFERPAPGARIRGVRARNAMASVLLVDDLESAPEERKREMIFCIYGTQNVFCGDAYVLRLKDGAKGDATPALKKFIQGIEFQSALP